ncbi:CBS domain-containing protein CBSCBSPB1 [Platanthera zijinensis]|uniref:CBS domain-containing protein CBSCBSPB1 n=1 Tax=Platanthera zijinensis TaxID=2320716 RepID=A0AAP0BT48_9ASPA
MEGTSFSPDSESDRSKPPESNPANAGRKSPIPRSLTIAGERTVKRLQLSKALTMPESSSILEVCQRMATRRVDAALLIESNALLCGILTDKDIAIRVIAHEINMEKTPVSEVMTRNPVFVLSDTLAVEALQKMLQGQFRHLPVVENGEVIALLDIAKCLYDAIARMERVVEKGRVVAAAVEGMEKQWGTSVPSPKTFFESLREKMFRPCLSTILPSYTKIAMVSPTDSVLTATKKMLELEASSAVVTDENKPKGILTCNVWFIAKGWMPKYDMINVVMTANPECGTIDTPILDALHTMHNGKFLHLPVVDRDGNIVSVIDVIHVTHSAIATDLQATECGRGVRLGLSSGGEEGDEDGWTRDQACRMSRWRGQGRSEDSGMLAVFVRQWRSPEAVDGVGDRDNKKEMLEIEEEEPVKRGGLLRIHDWGNDKRDEMQRLAVFCSSVAEEMGLMASGRG